MFRFLTLFLAMLSIWMAQPASGKDEACTDGSNCLCDTVGLRVGDTTAGGAQVVLCEDFENAAMDDGTGNGWAAAGYANGDSFDCPPHPGNSGAIADEGTEGNDCFNIVTEASCDGFSDCVFQGTRALGEKYDQGFRHATYGVKGFSDLNTFGVTYVFKYTPNFVRGPGPGHKPTEWNSDAQSFVVGQDVNSCNNGCTIGGSCDAGWSQKHSSGTQYLGSTTADLNWETRLFFVGAAPSVASTTVAKGRICTDSAGVMYWAPWGSDFEGGSFSWPLGTYGCIRTKWTGLGTSTSRLEQWWQDEGDTAESKVIDIGCANPPGCSTRNLNTADSTLPLDAIRFNNYFNGVQDATFTCGYGSTAISGGCVYAGLSRAYRYADNYVITNGDPVPCSAVGFGSSGPLPPQDPTATGAGFALREPTQDTRPAASGGPQPLRTLQECKVERYLDGALFDTIRRASSAPTGGGTWPTENTLAGIDPVTHCGKTVSFRATCRNQATMPAGTTGQSALASSPKLAPVTLPACPPPPEWAPQPPVISQLDALLERIYSPAWAAGLR